jgi:hypothetical protein
MDKVYPLPVKSQNIFSGIKFRYPFIMVEVDTGSGVDHHSIAMLVVTCHIAQSLLAATVYIRIAGNALAAP